MSSKPILVGLSICGEVVKKTVHLRPSWLPMIVNRNKMCQGNAVSMSALESAECGFVSPEPSFCFGQDENDSY